MARVRPGRLAALMTSFLATAAMAEPIVLTPGVHPFVDRRLVAEAEGVGHVLQRPVPRDEVLVMEKAWEGVMSGYGTVLRDADGQVRLYYRGGGDVDPPEVTCLATSRDGVAFVRPSLGLYDVRGTRENNVVFTAAPERKAYGESHNFAPFLDTNPAAGAGERWKAVALKVGQDDKGERKRMLTVLASPDGIKWKALSDAPVIREGGGFDSLNVAFYDEVAKQYVCYYRVGRDGKRSFARAHSSDFLHWETDPPLEFRPEQDEQWYTNGASPYPGVPGLLVAMPMRFVPERKTVGEPPKKTDGLSDAVLMTSRDGLAWDRTFREAWIRPGPDPANWGDAHGNNTPLTGIVETSAGEWSVYWFEGYLTGKPRIRRGSLRANGLASLRAGPGGGTVTTPLLRLPGEAARTLHLNYATSAAGSVRVEVLGPDGRPIEGYSATDCPEIYGDEPARPVTWTRQPTLPAGRDFRLRFQLRDADLFALIVR